MSCWARNECHAAAGKTRGVVSAFLESRTAAASALRATSTQLPPPLALRLLLRQRISLRFMTPIYLVRSPVLSGDSRDQRQ